MTFSTSSKTVGIQDISIELVSNLPRVRAIDVGGLPSASGVYFMAMEVPELHVLYIGSTANLKDRWERHEFMADLVYLTDIGINAFVSWLQLDWDEEDLRCMEVVAIRKLNPRLNHAHKNFDLRHNADSIPDERKQEVVASINKPLASYNRGDLIEMAEKLGFIGARFAARTKLESAVKTALGTLYSEKRRRVSYSSVRQHKRREGDFIHTIPVDVQMEAYSIVAGLTAEILDEFTIRQLKPIAAKCQVYRYSYMTAKELKESILKAKIDLEEKLLEPSTVLKSMDRSTY